MPNQAPEVADEINSGGVIDTHHHMVPAFYVDAVGPAKIAAVMPDGRVPQWSPALDLEVMDEFHIEKAVLSVSPGLWTDVVTEAVPLARKLNEFGARMVVDHPTRYGFFSVLPLPNVEASLKEIEYAYDELKADGVIIFTNYSGMYLGDPHFGPVFEELNRRNAVVFIHPTTTALSVKGIPDAILEFTFDTTRTTVSLIYAGVTVRNPNVKFILSHGGGTVPYLAARIDGPSRFNPALTKLLPNGAMAEFKKLYWDTALSFTETTLKSLLALTDSSKIVFGSDFPFAPKFMIPMGVASLKQQLAPVDFANVMHGTAAQLMPRLA